MNKRERVIAALNNQPVDKTPVGFWFHLPVDEHAPMDDTLKETAIKFHTDYYNELDLDIIKIMCDGYFDYPLSIDVKEAKDWYNLKPLGADHPFITDQVERVKGIMAGLNDKNSFVLYNVFAPFSSIRFGAPDELVMKHLKEDPAAIEYALGVIAEDNIALVRRLFEEAHVDGVYYCVQGGEKWRMSVEDYRAHITPTDKAVLAVANEYSKYNIMHCCGWAGDPNNLELWNDYECAAVNWAVYVENLGLQEGKEFFGGKCVLGGFDNTPKGIISTGNEEEVKEFTKNIIRSFKGNGLMLGSDCTLPRTINHERIQWVLDAVKEV